MVAERLQDIIEIYRFNESDSSFTSSCVLQFDEDVVTIKGLSSGISTEDAKGLRDYLVGLGIRELRYERRRVTGTLYKVVKLKGA